MSYYRECPYCGAHLDPGERCDCQDETMGNGQLTVDNYGIACGDGLE